MVGRRDRLGVNENDSQKWQLTTPYLRGGKGGVTDGSERVARDEEEWKVHRGGEIGGDKLGSVGGEETARGLDD